MFTHLAELTNWFHYKHAVDYKCMSLLYLYIRIRFEVYVVIQQTVVAV